MRNIKTVVIIVVLLGGAWAAMQWAAEDQNVRGQDPNVETRALNTSGLPDAAAGTTGTAWTGDEAFVSRAYQAHARLAAAHDGARAEEFRRDHDAARRELEALAHGKQWAVTPQAGAQVEPGSDHARALAMFVQAESQATDAELRAWAARSAAMIRNHE